MQIHLSLGVEKAKNVVGSIWAILFVSWSGAQGETGSVSKARSSATSKTEDSLGSSWFRQKNDIIYYQCNENKGSKIDGC